jgi:hypothetical protein
VVFDFGLYYRNDGTAGEMSMRWEELGGKLAPCLRVFFDAWEVLADFKDLLDELANANEKHITDSEFVEILKNVGLKI